MRDRIGGFDVVVGDSVQSADIDDVVSDFASIAGSILQHSMACG